MLVYRQKGRFPRTDLIMAWWPQSVSDVTAFLNHAPIVVLRQCPAAMVPALRSWAFRCQPFQTPLIDLTRPEQELWQNLEAKSCRYEIRKAQKMEFAISRNEAGDAARQVINDSIQRLRYRAQLSEEEWQALRPDHDIFLCRWQGVPLAAHVLLRDHPGRARLMLSGGADRGEERFHRVVGPGNRLLHWQELQDYKAEGFHCYDFGGCDLNKDSHHYRNTQFKLSFGGQVVEEPTIHLAKNPALRGFHMGLGLVRKTVRRIPWPERLLQMFRTRPRLLPWLR